MLVVRTGMAWERLKEGAVEGKGKGFKGKGL
jgi:hypothetical protein